MSCYTQALMSSIVGILSYLRGNWHDWVKTIAWSYNVCSLLLIIDRFYSNVFFVSGHPCWIIWYSSRKDERKMHGGHYLQLQNWLNEIKGFVLIFIYFNSNETKWIRITINDDRGYLMSCKPFPVLHSHMLWHQWVYRVLLVHGR